MQGNSAKKHKKQKKSMGGHRPCSPDSTRDMRDTIEKSKLTSSAEFGIGLDSSTKEKTKAEWFEEQLQAIES